MYLYEHGVKHGGDRVHVLLQVPVKELENKVQLSFALNAVLQSKRNDRILAFSSSEWVHRATYSTMFGCSSSLSSEISRRAYRWSKVSRG
jgi:hypothetical protein